MKVSREQAERNHEAVVETASRLFRAQGVDGVSIGEVMRQSGLTHGGFYNQFGSKEALAAEACALALGHSAERWRGIVDQAGDGALAALTDDYVSARNRDATETGCALVAVGADAARKGGDLAHAFREGLEGLAEILTGITSDRAQALAHLSQMVGALVLARAVDDAVLSQEILAAARASIGSDRTA